MNGRARVGIKAIASEAGVSIATVSRVLNGSGTVAEELRERVLDTARRLRYQPHALARSLRLQRTFTLGAVIPTITNPYFTEVVRAMQDTASLHGYTLLIANSDREPAKEAASLITLWERRVDGVILVPASATETPSAALRMLLEQGVAVVAVDRALPSLDLDRVVVDTRGGARAAVAHLVDRGRRRIAFVAGPPSISTAAEKLIGYREGLEQAGLAFDPALVLKGDYTSESGEAQAQALLALRPRPEAVLVANNLMTLGVFRVLLRRTVAIPQDMAVVGYDDVAWTDVVRPALTVVAQPTFELGRRAVELLVQRLATPAAEPAAARVEVLPAQLLIREST